MPPFTITTTSITLQGTTTLLRLLWKWNQEYHLRKRTDSEIANRQKFGNNKFWIKFKVCKKNVWLSGICNPVYAVESDRYGRTGGI